MKFTAKKREPGCPPCATEMSDEPAKLPCSSLPVPKGMAGVKLGEVVTVTITGKVKGFSDDSWDDTSRIELELHEADVKTKADGDEFAAMADDD